jgi:hypothetical protein
LAVPLQDLANGPPPQQEPEAAAAPADKPTKAAKKDAKKEKEDEDEPLPPTEQDTVTKKRGPANFNNAMVVGEAGVDVGSRMMKYSSVVVGQGFSLRSTRDRRVDRGHPALSGPTRAFRSPRTSVSSRARRLARVRSEDERQVSIGQGKWTLRLACEASARRGQTRSPLLVRRTAPGSTIFGRGVVVNDLPSVNYKFIRAA